MLVSLPRKGPSESPQGHVKKGLRSGLEKEATRAGHAVQLTLHWGRCNKSVGRAVNMEPCAARVTPSRPTMLFVALTRTTIALGLESYRPQVFSIRPGWLLTIVADGFLSKPEISPQQLQVREALGISREVPLVDFLTATFHQDTGVLEILRTLVSGRPGYYHVSRASYGDYEWVENQYHSTRDDVTRARQEYFRWEDGESFGNALSEYDLECDMGPTMAIWSKLAEGQGRLVYYPFAKRELLDYALSIPWDVKLKTPKHVLRAVARELDVPQFIITRPKIGFGISSDRWALSGGIFEASVPIAAKVVDLATIRELQGGDRRHAMTFWTLLNYAVWKRLFIFNESREALVEELMGNLGKSTSIRTS
jgi:Asparagine synthase